MMLRIIIPYMLYWLVAVWAYSKQSDKILYADGQLGDLHTWNLRHLAGIALLLGCPWLFGPLTFQFFPPGTYSFPVIIAILIAGYGLFNLSIINGCNLPYRADAPHGSSQQYVISILLRAVFLACYESYFRGLLLNTLANEIGIFSASFVSTALYSFCHCGSTKKELIATIPFGLFLCWLTVETQSILPAILLHWLIALPAEIIAGYKLVHPLYRTL